MKNIYYPIIRIPENLISAMISKIPLPDAPNPPTKPTKGKASSSGFLAIGIGIIIVEAVNGASIETIGYTLFIVLILTLVLYIKDVYDKEKEYDKNLSSFYDKSKQWELKKKQYEKDIQTIRNPIDTKIYRKRLILELLKKTEKPLKGQLTPKRGFSENYFYEHLKEQFPNMIFRNYILEEFSNNRAYQPDFILQDKITGLHIDIEIDEPYVFENKKPIHYIDEDGIHTDINRDHYFNLKGWIVIRFAENQIVETPLECCKVVSNIIRAVTKRNFMKDFKSEFKINTKCWTKNVALKLAENNERKKYIENINFSNFKTNEHNNEIIIMSKSYEGDDLPF